MSLKRLSRVFGSVFDVTALSEIPDDDCHVIFVSGRTLYLMQHLGNNEVNFLARYADSFSEDGRYYDSVDLDSPNVDLVQRIAQDYRLEVLDMQCGDVITAIENLTAQVGLINTAVSGQSGCGCDGGAFDPEALGNEDVPEMDQAYLDGKCETANIIVDKVQYAIRQLDIVNLDVLLLGGISAATAVIAALVLAGPAGWGTILGIGVVSSILLLLAQLGVGELGDIDTVISANQDDLVNALFSAVSTEAAKTAFLAVLDGAAIGAVGQGIVGFMLFNDVLNQLFVPSGTYIGEEYDYLNDDYVPSECVQQCLAFGIVGGSGGGDADAQVDDLGSGQYRLTSTSVLVGGAYRASIYFGFDEILNDLCDPAPIGRPTRALYLDLVSGALTNAGEDIWRIQALNDPPTLDYSSDDPPAPTVFLSNQMGTFLVTSGSEFVVDISFTAFV
jgi:hypothetical protein